MNRETDLCEGQGVVSCLPVQVQSGTAGQISPCQSTATYPSIMRRQEMYINNLDPLESYDFEADDFETELMNKNKPTSGWAILYCDICDPLHSYYNAHPRRKRIRAGLPRLFYCISVFQIATLIAATLTISGDFCGPLPGSLAGQVKPTTTTTATPPMPLLQPQIATQSLSHQQSAARNTVKQHGAPLPRTTSKTKK